jgi:hypothetical protein
VSARLSHSAAPLATLSVALLLVVPATAQAREGYAPPGNSSVQEFIETLPDGSGDVVTNNIANLLLQPPRSSTLPPQARAALRRLGPDGRAAAALAEAGAAGSDRRPAREANVAPEGKAPLVATVARLGGASGSGGMGLALPIIVILSVLAALGYGLLTMARRADS